MRLVLFFTRAMSLERWRDDGVLEREKVTYERHLQCGTLSEVHWLTYGSRDAEIASQLHLEGRLDARIRVWAMPRFFVIPRIGSWLYMLLLPWICARIIKRVDVLKTNQLDGALAAAIARRCSEIPLLVRCGYVQSKLERSLNSIPRWRLRLMLWSERRAYETADWAIVTSGHDECYVTRVHGMDGNRLRVIPNLIDTNHFYPAAKVESLTCEGRDRWLFVGRLAPQKNLVNLIRACSALQIGLDLVGDGPCAGNLRTVAQELQADVRFLGRVDNKVLPSVLREHRFFVLPSLVEGHPKSLLEAMSCGLTCVGTNVDGIREVLEDGVNGFLARGTSAEALCQVMRRAMKEGGEHNGMKAVEKVRTTYSIDVCVNAEKEIIESLASAICVSK